jgi:hypothetical protein
MMKKYRLVALIAIFFAFSSYTAKNAAAVELVTNGSFETGALTGWTAVNGINPWRNWTVSTAGFGGGYSPLPVATSPQHGTRDAWQGVAGNAGATFTLSQDVAVPAGTSSFTWKDRFQQNLTTYCTISTCGTNIYRVQILNTSNVVLQTLYTSTALPVTNHDTGWQTHYFLLNAFAGQTIRIRFSTVVSAFYDGPGQLEVDAVSIQSPAVPTAANVSVGGRITTASGIGIKNTGISLTDSQGNIRTAISNPFGYYKFDNLTAGETVVLSVSSKSYSFDNPTQVLTLDDNVTNVNFVGHW